MERGDLVDAAPLLTELDELLGLGHGDGLALAGVVEHVAHMAHEDAQALVQIAAALAHEPADPAALAGRHAHMAVVVLDVLVAALVVDGDGVRGDGALHRDDAHDAGAHGGVGRVVDLAVGGVLVEGVGDLGVGQTELLVYQQELKNAGGIGRQQVDLQPHLGHDDLDHQADLGDLVQHFLGALDAEPGLAGDDGDERGLHTGQGQHDGDLLVGDPLLEHPVLRAVRRDLVVMVLDLLTQLDQILSHLQRKTLLIL